MTPEENKRRSNDNNVKYIKEHLYDKDKNKPFVFISYKSDDWEIVLHDIVYRLVKDYGLNVYFDGSFDTHNSLWIEQFPENMDSDLCVGVLNFIDGKYATSYATLLELMYSQTCRANEMNIVPVYLSPLTKTSREEGEQNTGLGVKYYEDRTVNVHAESEKDTFDKTFKELAERKILDKSKFLYDEKKPLTKKICFEMVTELLEKKKVNDNYYNGELDAIVGSIKDAFGDEVFSKIGTGSGTGSVPDPVPVPVPPVDDDIYYYYKAAGGNSVVKKNSLGEYCILKGSKMSPKASYGQELRDDLVNSGVVVDGEFQQDYAANSPSKAAKLICGYSVNGKTAFNDRIRITKEQAYKILSDIKEQVIVEPPIVQPPVPPVDDIYYYYKAAGGYAIVKKTPLGEYCILKGSKMSPKATFGQKLRDELANLRAVVDGEFQLDYVANSSSQAAGLISGSSTSGPRAFTDEKIVTKEQAERILARLQNADNEPSVSNAEEKASGNNTIKPNRLI